MKKIRVKDQELPSAAIGVVTEVLETEDKNYFYKLNIDGLVLTFDNSKVTLNESSAGKNVIQALILKFRVAKFVSDLMLPEYLQYINQLSR